MAVDNALIDDLVEKITQGIRTIGVLKSEAESQVRSVVQSVLNELDVVTGERMRVQEALLAKARKEIDALEKRVKVLEQRLTKQEGGTKPS